MAKKTKSSDMPYTEQQFYPNMPDLGMANVIPRSKEFDLEKTEDECTFKVVKRGNQP